VKRTVLRAGDRLPLTCTRSGTCCHGKDIRITPWELALLAAARGLPAAEFLATSTSHGGTRLRMDGPAGWRGLPACGLYDSAAGCTVHGARPLACRLYPLGRELQAGAERWIHEGSRFPCLDGCPEVRDLPSLTVADYLAGQGVGPFTRVRDLYLEIAQDLADSALTLIHEGGLPAAPRAAAVAAVRRCPDGAAARIAVLGPWAGLVGAPGLPADALDGEAWTGRHAGLLQRAAQDEAASGPEQAAAVAGRLAAAALQFIDAVGGDAAQVGRRWCSGL
jgi:Fe-S-cluster containining protein